MAAAEPEVAERGGRIVAVGPAAGYQAQHLMDTTIPFPLLLDQDGAVSHALRLNRQRLLTFVFNLRAWVRWVGAFIRHRRQYRITGHYSEVPAVAIVAAGGEVVWLHRGRSIGDYPKIEHVLEQLRRNTTTA